MLDSVEQAEAETLYRHACAHLFEITLSAPGARFYNRLEGYNLDSVVFGRCEGVAQRFRRDREHIAADGGDTVHAVLVLESEGWRADYDGRDVDHTMGAIRIMDMGRPFDLTTGSFRTLNVMLPRRLLGDAGQLDLHGLVIAEDSVSGSLLASHLRALWATSERLTEAEVSGVVAATAGLIASAVNAHAGPSTGGRTSYRSLLAAARTFVDAHIENPELTPEGLRTHLGVSRSHLYQVFEPVGGVSSFIQTRRLDRAFDAILGDRTDRRTLAGIGYAHGFRSDAHFNRVFRSRFGLTPGQLRRRSAQTAPGGLSVVERPDDVWTWLRSL